MTVKEIKAKLDALGVPYDDTALKADLEAILEVAQAVKPADANSPAGNGPAGFSGRAV